MKDLAPWIKACEGYSSHIYSDTKGIPSIGWGRNLRSVGIRPDEAELMFQNDVKEATESLQLHDWYTMQPIGVKMALVNMCFNMGIERLLEFEGMIAALKIRNYTMAATEALASRWSVEVGQRARDVALMIRQGV